MISEKQMKTRLAWLNDNFETLSLDERIERDTLIQTLRKPTLVVSKPHRSFRIHRPYSKKTKVELIASGLIICLLISYAAVLGLTPASQVNSSNLAMLVSSKLQTYEGDPISLSNLQDTASFIGLLNGQVLTYNSTTGLWQNENSTGSGISNSYSMENLTDAAYVGLANGDIPVWNGSAWTNELPFTASWNATVNQLVSSATINWTQISGASTQVNSLISTYLASNPPIAWQGSLASAPATPQTGWAYYNTVAGISYIYNGTAWNQIAQNGANGTNGTNGTNGINGSNGSNGANGANALQPVNTVTFDMGVWANGTYFSQNGTDGSIFSSNANYVYLLNTTLLNMPNGGTIKNSVGYFNLTSSPTNSITDMGINNVLFEGSGAGTIFYAPMMFNYKVFNIGATNWTLQNFQVQGNQQSQGGNGGIYVSSSARNTIVQNIILVNCTTGLMNYGYNTKLLDNSIFNCINDGITLDCDRATVAGNFINSTQVYNGIALVNTNNSVISNNIIQNVAANGIGLENLGAGPCVNDQFDSNNIYSTTLDVVRIYAASGGIDSAISCTFTNTNGNNSAQDGFQFLSGYNLNFVGGSLSNIARHGVYVHAGTDININSVNQLTVAGSAFLSDAGTDVHYSNSNFAGITGAAIYIQAAGSGWVFQNNYFTNLTTYAFRADSGSGITFSNNQVHSVVGTPNIIGIVGCSNYHVDYNQLVLGAYGSIGIYVLTTGATGTIIGNILTCTANGQKGIYVNAAATDILIQNNNIIYSGTSSAAIVIGSTPTYITISGNDVHLSTVKITLPSAYTNIFISNNLGYNSVGVIANPLYVASGNANNTIIDAGNNATWISGTTYTNYGSPKELVITGGTVTAIVQDGTTLFTTATTCTLVLQTGDTFSCTFSSVPTIVVYGQ